MRIAVVHQSASEDSTADEQDVLAQRDSVLAALTQLGHETCVVECSLDLAALRHQLLSWAPEVAFNLVESLSGSDRLMTLIPRLLAALRLPFTGFSAEAIEATSSKLVAKRQLALLGLPTLPWLVAGESNMQGEVNWPSRWILKAVHEHASAGMTDEAVLRCQSLAELRQRLSDWQVRAQVPCFAELFAEGREFNLSLLPGPELLPSAEIDFRGFAPGKPRIVGFAAKWQEQSAEFVGTPRTFDFPASDQPLLERLRELALECWRRFELSGYARVDFRVDEQGEPWILEINANPCLSPDAGFAAAVERSGRTFAEAIQQIVQAATVG